eukprot:scaffold29365_cov153-Amphora_coffeaeformis.AAC.4
MKIQRAVLLAAVTMLMTGISGLQQPLSTRRQALATVSTLVSGGAAWNVIGPNDAALAIETLALESRDRKNNRDALIREDFWFQTGKLPPRLLTSSLQGDDPQWNAFGSCTSSVDGGNSCTYVSLKQRGPAYAKYGSTIAQGGKEYEALGKILRQSNPDWAQALGLIRADLGAATVDAELKMILLATALMTSPNFPIPSKELLVARYYANEIHYAQGKLRTAVEERNREDALQIWEFGKDGWNSYFTVVNRSITPKVGDKFELIV